jgi:hypothetical protein
VLGRAVDRRHLAAGDAIEHAADPERLGERADQCREQDARAPDLTDRELHRPIAAEADPVGALVDEADEEAREARCLDRRDRVGAPLRDRDHPLAHEQQVAGRQVRHRVSLDDVRQIVR